MRALGVFALPKLAMRIAVIIVGTMILSAAQAADLNSELLTKLRNSVSNATALTEEQRGRLTEDLRGAAADLELSTRFDAELKTLQEALDSSNRKIADFEARVRDIQEAPANLERRLGDSPSLSAIETEIGVVESQRESWSQERKTALDAQATLAKTDAALRDRLAAIALAVKGATAPTAGDSADLDTTDLETAVSAAIEAAENKALKSEQAVIELKLKGTPVLSDLRTAKIAWLDATVSEADALLIELRDAAADRRQTAAIQRGAETRRLLSQLSSPRPELQAFADSNLELVEHSQSLAKEIEAARQGLAGTRQLTEGIEQDANLTQRRLEVAGLEAQLGEVMLSRLASLPDSQAILSANRTRNEQIADVSIGAIDTEQALRDMGDRQTYFGLSFGPRTEWNASELRVADRLYDQRRELLQELLQSENTLLRLLVDENQAAEQLARVSSDYEQMLTGALLWVRNYAFFDAEHLMQQLDDIISIEPLRHLRDDWPRVVRDPATIALLLLALITLWRHRRFSALLEHKIGKPIRPRDESTRLILETLALTILMVAPIPLLIFWMSRVVEVLGGQAPLMTGISGVLFNVAQLLLALYLLRAMADRLGVGRRLLKWNSPRCDAFTNDLRWFLPIAATALAVTALGRGSSPTDSGGPLAAAGSFVISVAILFYAVRMLRSETFGADGLLKLFFRAAALISAAIIIMHLSGQLFAAHLYLQALGLSIAAVVGTLLIINVIQRMLMLYRANLEREKKEALKASEAEEDSDSEEGTQESDLEAVASLSEAYNQLLGLVRLLSLGALLWFIWSPALPALSILDTVTLWTATDPQLPADTVRNITLSVLLLALLVIAVTMLVTRHLPPLLNVVLMEWTTVTPGSRYAAGMLMQYVIIGVGFSIALMMLGFKWEKVQWLVAALGVGIGFGLQEIVANFISGLIVLFERPIRVGDIINAGGADGTVTRINPRATVIETFEGKELMIPNKELITSVVTNWSLSSPKLRVLVPIGIAYGSDVDDAIRRLENIAKRHVEVLDDPEPVVTFEDFGDNALVLWLRCYAIKDYIRVATELRRIIYREFNEAQISIAFPQRDVHLTTPEPLSVRMLREDPDA